MLLRVSGQVQNEELDLAAVVTGEGGGGVADGDTLAAFAEAVLGADDAALAGIRTDLIAAVGEAGAVDAAAIAAIFNTNDRIADATGIPLDEGTDEARVSIGTEIGIDHFTGAPGG